MTNKTKDTKIVKSVNTELKQVLFIAMVPDEVDLHGDVTSAEEVLKACHSYNLSARNTSLYHVVPTKQFDIVESYVLETDIVLNDIEVKKGTWLVKLQVYTDELWELIKSGEINGVSIGAMAKATNIEDNE
jgi:hypothetical protein